MASAVLVVVKISGFVTASSHLLLINSIPRTLFSSNNKNNRGRCCSTRYGGRSKSDSNGGNNIRSERFRFNFDDEYLKDENDEAFRFRSDDKKRAWWSSEGFDDDDDDGEEDEFGFREASIGFDSIFKILRAFGWMVPAIGISMLLGTGSNTIVMALALPLAQSALSLLTDALMGRWNGNPRPKPRPKKRPFSRAATNVGTNKRKQQKPTRTNTEEVKNYYQSSEEDSVRKGGYRGKTNFGGWDELDKSEKVPHMAQTKKANEPWQSRKIDLSRRSRNREKPLLLRLMIAVFPFLGSWTKLL